MNDIALEKISFSFLDWTTVGVFLAIVIGFAMWVKFTQRGSEDFFLAGRSMNWVIVLFSIFATLFSTISFVSVPGEAYQNGLMFSLIMVGGVLFYPLGIWLFLRFFFRTRTFTAYEYLEHRYNLATRLFGAVIYCVVRLLYAGTVFYAAARIFESLVGWSPMATILCVGFFTVIYATTGGMKAVMFTDMVQGIVVIIGIIAITAKLLQLSGFDLSKIYAYAAEHGRGYETVMKREFYTLDFHERFNSWLFLINIITIPLISLSADQSVVQRLLSSKGYIGARRAVVVNAIISVPIVGMLWLIGIGLFYYYGTGIGLLPEGVTSDHVLGYFINTELPSPLPGLILAALLAALMSTIDSTVNCIANVIHRDGLIRLKIMKVGAKHEMLVCRSLSAFAGCFGIMIAVILTIGSKGILSSIFEISTIWSGLWGVLLMAFLLGVLVPRVSSGSILIGMIVATILNLSLPYFLYYSVPADERISFVWITMPGLIVAGLLPLILSLFMPNKKDLRGLTLWTLSSGERG